MNIEKVINYIVNWLKDYVVNVKMDGFVVGVSGGIDFVVILIFCVMIGLCILCVEMFIY